MTENLFGMQEQSNSPFAFHHDRQIITRLITCFFGKGCCSFALCVLFCLSWHGEGVCLQASRATLQCPCTTSLTTGCLTPPIRTTPHTHAPSAPWRPPGGRPVALAAPRLGTSGAWGLKASQSGPASLTNCTSHCGGKLVLRTWLSTPQRAPY